MWLCGNMVEPDKNLAPKVMNTIIIISIMELAVLLADLQLVDCANVWVVFEIAPLYIKGHSTP